MVFAVAILLTLIAASSGKSADGCFESIVSFGDSLADTGNYPLLCAADNQPAPRYVRPPYGRTFFHRPTGRCSDGRLVIDFIGTTALNVNILILYMLLLCLCLNPINYIHLCICHKSRVARSLGLPFVQPYIAGGGGEGAGVNFAVIGATALDYDYYYKIGIINTYTNVSLGTQLDWFKQYLATIPDSRRYLQKSLVVMGEIGGNDYNHPIMQRASSFQVVQSLAPLVVDYIGSTIQELIKLGAETLLVPGNLPIGCLPIYLTEFEASSSAQDYDPKTGCLNWLNDFAVYHNELLQGELSRIRQLYPHARLIYADYYNAAMRFYLAPDQFGFSEGEVLRACCGGGGAYNYDGTALCGIPPATSCDDPASYANWDGLHFTEAAYRAIAQALLQGPYTTPHITTVCPSLTTRKATTAHVYHY